jgi:flagellar hook assembly protein FlgD
VVIIVGPVGSSTAGYKRDADEAAAAARQWTTNVITIYTPKATWATVKPALQNASIVVYMGHGNGWPSPYAPFQTETKDGLGLDPPTGANGTATKYYGERYLRDYIHLAPNAVVLLYHLCYASGNSEPQDPERSLSDTKERVDNFGAGFIDAGAKVVIADAYGSRGGDYINQLFQTRRTMAEIFEAARSNHHNPLGPYSSVRSPGMKYVLDTDHPSAPFGYHRSMVGNFAITSVQVTGAKYAPVGGLALTGEMGDPGFYRGPVTVAATLADPNAPNAPQASVDHSWNETDLPLVVSEPGSHVVDAEFLDTAGLRAMPHAAFTIDLEVPTITAGAEVTFTPNGDAVTETAAIPFVASEAGRATVIVRDAEGGVLRSLTGVTAAGATSIVWNGKNTAGAIVPNGRYVVEITPLDRAGNVGPMVPTSVVVFGALTAVSAAPVRFFPQDADSLATRTTASFRLLASATVTVTVRNAAGAKVRTITAAVPMAAGIRSAVWNGRLDSGAFAPRGLYRLVVSATDGIGSAALSTASIRADAFKIAPSATVVTRGHRLTVTVTSAEPLKTTPRLTVKQPGKAAYTMTMVKVSTSVWRLSFTMHTGGSAGTTTLSVRATAARAASTARA